MSQNQSLTVEQRIGIKLTQQQLRYVKLLEYSAAEFDEAVARELEDNPALEAHEPDRELTDVSSQTADGDMFTETSEQIMRADYRREEDMPLSQRRSEDSLDISSFIPAEGESLAEHLGHQLDALELDPDVARMARYIIGNIDSNGYLRRDLRHLVDDMAFGQGYEVSLETASMALDAVRGMDPVGVGAFDLRDTLLLQLRNLPSSPSRDDAVKIIEECFEEFAMKHTPQIMASLKMDKERVSEALRLILSLNPKPGSSYGGEQGAQPIIPDFIVNCEEDDISIVLNNNIPALRVERSFERAVAELTSASGRKRRKGSEFVVDRTNDAVEFIRTVRQRQQTLMCVMGAIVDIQKDYFLSGDVYTLKPMMIKDISSRTGLDISVISRATKNKYVQTPYDIVPMRFFFGDSIGGENEDTDAVTNRKLEAAIKSLVESENKAKPLSDEKLRELLINRGLDVSRRTVAKYRDRLKIPVARLRRDL